jgi:membrane peptidoglycan carboxypeptidase
VAGPVSAFLRVACTPGQRGVEVEADLDLEALRRAVRAAGPSRLAGPFCWRPFDPAPDEAPREIVVGPENPAFVPLAELPPHLVRAITASEDGGFFGHRGFDFREMANAVSERGTGRIRGASTITQQLAKNLFLSPDRTLARKVREALGTVALEASLPKARILEIYLNIAEWGPGVYGVGEGARFWLGKDARDVTPREAAFLASVIPSPRRFHARHHRSGLTPWWRDRIADILGKMRQQGQLTEAQLAEALAEPLAPLDRQHPPDVNESEPPPAYADPAASEESTAPE